MWSLGVAAKIMGWMRLAIYVVDSDGDGNVTGQQLDEMEFE